MPAERALRSAARIRLWFLVTLLAATMAWAWHDIRSRRARTEWRQPVEVAVALVELGAVDASAVRELRASFPALESRLSAEYHRYGGGLAEPIHFTVFGPVTVDRPSPIDPDGSIWSLAQHAYTQWRWTRVVDAASELPTRAFDSRIYVVLRAPRESARSWVEGSSDEGGRVGVARIELAESTVELTLFVVTHELFHTLGASDKYDANGQALVPAGLVEPSRVPLYPQRYAEVMMRNVVIAPGIERPPDSLAELGVGSETAREIGWASSEPPK